MEDMLNIWSCSAIVLVIAVLTVLIALLISKIAPEQVDKIREWLVYATAIAEKEFGGGTGRLKLRYVYDLFVAKFPWLSKIVSFNFFSDLVDDALDEMNYLIDTNPAIQSYVAPETTECDDTYDEINLD